MNLPTKVTTDFENSNGKKGLGRFITIHKIFLATLFYRKSSTNAFTGAQSPTLCGGTFQGSREAEIIILFLNLFLMLFK